MVSEPDTGERKLDDIELKSEGVTIVEELSANIIKRYRIHGIGKRLAQYE